MALVLFGLGYGGAQMAIYSRIDKQDEPVSADTNAAATQISRGEYIARTADCFACHTAPNGKALAGGLAMQTPLGAVYSTNITPNKETGIGNYRYADFKNAVQHGVRVDGSPLYPAMPYPSYALMPEADMQAMYAYFMHGVEPVKQSNASTTLPPVLNWRWPLAYWQMLFAPKRSFVTDSRHNETINRGKYLVEGPGHCGACHTPRGLAYQEKALADDQQYFLSGAVIDGWRAKSLRGEARGLGWWSAEELADFFRSGRTKRSAAFGAMADVVEHSTQYMNDDDIRAMSAYLKTLSPTPDKAAAMADKNDTTTRDLQNGHYTSPGAILYSAYCITCHRADGNGMARIFPALNRNSAVVANQAQSVIQITLEGGRMPNTRHDNMALTMPSFSQLSDEDVATVVNFVRNSWHNQAPEINARDVGDIRRFVAGKAPNIQTDGQSEGGSHE